MTRVFVTDEFVELTSRDLPKADDERALASPVTARVTSSPRLLLCDGPDMAGARPW
jgi:hypothetical protein